VKRKVGQISAHEKGSSSDCALALYHHFGKIVTTGKRLIFDFGNIFGNRYRSETVAETERAAFDLFQTVRKTREVIPLQKKVLEPICVSPSGRETLSSFSQ
jgi:hypothetical protein